ncbi:MAG: lipopolysaccharide biosynthesis protein [Alphaproteobacteria bacterium]|nr:lipopolysaccharide biosynthesis protein [Alphaproteobacteria bacterium]
MAKGAFWLFLEKGAQQISSFVVFAVIARIIGPSEYGLVALCTMVMMLMNNVTLGLVDAIISMRIRDEERLSSLFFMISGLGFALSLLSFFLAQPFALLFEYERLAPLLQAFSPLPFLFSLAAVPTALITATMDFRIFTIRTFFAALAGGIAGIWAVLNGFGAFSLALQQITAQGAILIVLWFTSSWRPRLIFKTKAMADMLRLGLAQTGTLFVSFLDTQSPRFILGLFLGPLAVGYYAFVARVCGAIQDGIIQPVLTVIYPALAELDDDHAQKKVIVKQTFFVAGLIMIPVVGGMILTADVFIPFLFGKQWEDSALAMQIFALTSFTFAINTILRSILRACRQTAAYLRAQTMVVTIGVLGSFAAVAYGFEAVVIWKTIVTFLALISYSLLVRKRARLSLKEGYKTLASPLFSGLVMMIGLWLFTQSPLVPSAAFFNLVIMVVLGAFIYGGVLVLSERKRLKSLLKKIRQRV